MRMADGRKRLRRGDRDRRSRQIIKQKLKAYKISTPARGTESLSTGFIWIYHCNTRKQTRGQFHRAA